MIIAIENSTWNNIGDAFYQSCIEHAFKVAHPNHRIVTFDGPSNRAFRAGFWIKNAIDIRQYFRADHFVFSGPIISSSFIDRYSELIQAIKDAGKSYSLISVHASASGQDLDTISEFLKLYPPSALHTRDDYTYTKLRGIADYEFPGVCFAFFARSLSSIPEVVLDDPYICSSFYAMQEPEFAVIRDDEGEVERLILKRKPTTILPWRVARHLQFLRSYRNEQDGFRVLRPVHDAFRFPNVSFARPNSYLTYNPMIFLSIYKYCAATISDRVHAGVVSLSFGKPALIVRRDNRYELFKNSIVKENDGVLRANQNELDIQYKMHIDWLTGIPL